MEIHLGVRPSLSAWKLWDYLMGTGCRWLDMRFEFGCQGRDGFTLSSSEQPLFYNRSFTLWLGCCAAYSHGQREAGLQRNPNHVPGHPSTPSDCSHFPCGHTRLPLVFSLTDLWFERSLKTEYNNHITLPPLGAGDIPGQWFLNFLQIFLAGWWKLWPSS